jgi:hypothetical protein
VTQVATAASDDIQIESTGPVEPDPAPVPVETPVESDASLDAADPGDEDSPDPAPAAEPKKDRRSLQAKIDGAVAKQREAERRAEAAERELTQYRQPARTEPTKAEPQYTRPKPTEDEVGTTYKTYPEFIEALQDWKLEQRDAQQAIETQRRESAQRHESHATKFSERIQKAEEADPQYWSKISPAVANLTPSTAYDPADVRRAREAAYRGDPTARSFLSSIELADLIFDSDSSTDLMAHFSANDHDLQRLSTLPPKLIAREIGRLEASFSRPAAADSGPAPTRVISSAPAPIKPVGTSASPGDPNPLEDDLDMDEHIRVMNARDRKKARR